MSLLDAIRPSGPDLPEVPLSVSLALDLLKNDRRRLIIELVAEADQEDETTTVKEAALAVTRAEENCDPRECTSQERKRGYVAVQQTHAPRLEEDGVLETVRTSNRRELHATELTHALNEWGSHLERHFVGDETTTQQEHTDFEALREEVLAA